VADWWVALGASAITGLAVLLAGYGAQWFEGRHKPQRWLRDRRAERYDAVMREHGRRLVSAAELVAFEGDDAARAEAHGRAAKQLISLMDAITKLQVTGSKKVNPLADGLGEQIQAYRGDLQRAEVSAAWNALTEAIRKDLGVTD